MRFAIVRDGARIKYKLMGVMVYFCQIEFIHMVKKLVWTDKK